MSGLVGQLSCLPLTITLCATCNSIIRMLWPLLPNRENQTCSLPLSGILPGQKSLITFSPIKAGVILHSCSQECFGSTCRIMCWSLGKRYSQQIPGNGWRYHVIEFPKQGLPHAPLVLTFKQDNRLLGAADVVSIISAKIPSRQQFPLLHETILNQMMHGPCGQDDPNCPCMINNACSKKFPFPFCDKTNINVQEYPQYQHRQNGLTVQKQVPPGGMVALTNQYVVPSKRYLCQKYNCSINVEAGMISTAVKYLYKYIYKGHDCTDVQIT